MMKTTHSITKLLDFSDHNMSGMNGFRNEQKYLCSDAELLQLQIRLKNLLRTDPHAREDGTYLIRSVYFDTYDNRCMHENEDGTSPREKWRIRYYNRSLDRITLECKLHENTLIHKTSCEISREVFQALLQGDLPPIRSDQPALLNRFLLLCRTEMMHPVVLVEYERCPFICREGNVRITFDRNIASSPDFSVPDAPLLRCRPILPQGMQLLEVKFDEFLPDSVYHAIQMENMQRVAFSKYFLSRRYSL